MRRSSLMIPLGLLIACSESFEPASAVNDFRVVAAEVGVQGAPGRANPNAEDPVEVSILAIDQGAPAPEEGDALPLTPGLLQWALEPCIPLPVTIGPPICSVSIEPCEGCVATPPADPLALPIARFSIPSQEALEAAEASSVLLQGIVCSNGRPSEDAVLRFLRGESDDLAPCEGPPTVEGTPIEGRFVTVTISLEANLEVPNLNPSLQNALLDGVRWPPPYDEGVPRSAPRTGCAADLEDLTPEEQSAHPRAGAAPSTIDLSVTPDSLQTYSGEDTEQTEEIQVSWLGDGGAFEQSFSFITDPARSVLTQWQPMQSVPEEGRLVRFHFVIRDGRGGTDWFERGLCIRPPGGG